MREVEAGGALFPIPDDLPFDRAALAEPLGVGMHAVERAQLAAGEKVAIFGAGPIGLMALAVLRWRGFDDVAIVDLSAKRLAIARELGAALALNAGEGDCGARSTSCTAPRSGSASCRARARTPTSRRRARRR